MGLAGKVIELLREEGADRAKVERVADRMAAQELPGFDRDEFIREALA